MTGRSYTHARVLLVALILALVVLRGGSVAADASPAAAERRATLALSSLEPLSVAGRGFKVSERVRVSAESSRKSLRASSRGRFLVRFADVDPCNGVVVTAVGSKGSRASITFTGTWRLHCAAP
jgi:hypothetical protein